MSENTWTTSRTRVLCSHCLHDLTEQRAAAYAAGFEAGARAFQEMAALKFEKAMPAVAFGISALPLPEVDDAKGP
jgi:hypothetical protein